MGLEGKIAVVTGGASGIGRATCLELAARGASVAVVDVSGERLQDCTAELLGRHPGCGGVGIVADVRDSGAVTAMVEEVVTRFGRLDLLVHSAGILRPPGQGPRMLHQVSVEEWDAVIDVNLKGTFLCNRAVVPVMIRQRGGQIINLSSTSGLKGRAFDSVYCASKFGTIGLSEALAEEVRGHGIRVHVVLPDAVDTPIWQQNGPIQPPEESLPPERVAELIAYLAELPEDTVLDHLVIRAFRGRRRRKKTAASADTPPTEQSHV